MNEEGLKQRTKKFALQVIELVGKLPKNMKGDVLGRQLMRSATSVGANYLAACRGRSKADFIAKMGIVIEEADECLYWLELIQEAGLLPEAQVIPLHQEANELTAIFVASTKTARRNLQSAI